MKKKVVIYANCQGVALANILRNHPTLSEEYDFDSATILSNYLLLQTSGDFPYYEQFAEADLLIYQPVSSAHGSYSTNELLKTVRPECKCISFVYLYNYAFWETLVFADGDYDVGTLGMKYATLNHQPITSLRDQGIPFSEVADRIRAGTLDWRFKERYETSQAILREKEAACTIRVADFIDAEHKDHLLFYTQNHPTMYFLCWVAKRILEQTGHDPALLPPEEKLPFPDYNSGRGVSPHFQFGPAAWAYYGFRFIPKPGPATLGAVVDQARRIYDGVYVNR
jgi:hypothetical protein